MNPALWFLLTRTLRNSVLFRLKRLRQPKYAISAVLGIAYFYLYFYRFLFRGDFESHRQAIPPIDLGITSDITLNLGALALLAFTLLLAWIMPAARTALTFTEAEIAYLMPAPLSRPTLIRYKLLKSQLGLLLLAIMMTLFTGRFARDGHAWLHAGGWWVVFATLQLHRLGASFVLTRLIDRGLSNARRRLFVLAGMAAVVGLLFAWRQSAPARPDLHTIFTGGRLGAYLGELATTGPAPWLLLPFRLIIAPYFAADPLAFLRALAPALGIMALHYLWVTRADVAFEEASVELSQKRAAFLAARRGGDMRLTTAPRRKKTAIFTLRPQGLAPIAFLWKSWIQAGGRKTLRLGVLATVALVAAALVAPRFTSVNSLAFLPGLAAYVAGMVTFFLSPQLTGQMMRRELNAADWLKTLPVPGWQLILGQLTGPACSAAAVQIAALAVIWASSSATAELTHTALRFAPVVFASALLFLPAFNLVNSLVPTGVMLLFPGWFKPGEQRGIEATGLGLLMLLSQFLILALALIGPAIGFVAVGFGVKMIAPLWLAGLAGGITAAIALALEGALGILLLGHVFDRFDASQE